MRGFAAAGAGALCSVALGCTLLAPAPVVQSQTMRVPEGALTRVAVMPFYPKETLSKYAGEGCGVYVYGYDHFFVRTSARPTLGGAASTWNK